MCCFFTIYSTNIPSNTEIYLDEFRKLITFKFADPNKAINYFFPNFDLNKMLEAQKERLTGAQESSGFK